MSYLLSIDSLKRDVNRFTVFYKTKYIARLSTKNCYLILGDGVFFVNTTNLTTH